MLKIMWENPYFNLVAAVWYYGAALRKNIIIYYAALIAAQISISLSPYAFGRAIDVMQNFQPARINELVFWLCFGVGVVLLFWLFHGPARILERHTALKIQQKFRLQMYQDLTRLPLKWHQNNHSGNICTRVNRAATALYRFAEDQFLYIQIIIKFLTSIGFLFWISWPVGGISLFFSVLAWMTVLLFDRKLIPLYNAENEIDNHVGAVLFDYINNMTTVLTLRFGELTCTNLKKRILSIWPFFRKDVWLNESKWFTLMIFLSVVQTVILLGYIFHMLDITGTIMIGVVVMMFRYQWELNQVFYSLAEQYGTIVHLETDLRGMQPILDDIKLFAHLPQGAAIARQWHNITIDHLTFEHDINNKRGRVFKKISFKIQRGEKIALIGTSGAGKSTLLNLLCGLYTPSQVVLTIDNVVFDSLEPLQAITTLIPQEPEIFENTIAFNIYMDLPIKKEEIEQVIKLSRFSTVLAELPDGLLTDMREKGLNFSVGQKQRLALARGLFAARYSSLILMDEPTSSVDLPTELEILSGVIKAFPHTALIVSLHRLHLLPNFDSIIMLRDGKVVANGPTHELLKKPGPVYELWNKYKQDDDMK